MTYTTREIQKRLRALDFDPGPIDGIRGRLTIRAIKAFQKSKRIAVDGIVGPITLSKLFGPEAKKVAIESLPGYTPWMDLAKSKMGLIETTNKHTLMDFLKLGRGTIGDPSRIPWCGDFVETCISVTLVDEPMVNNPYASINWLKFGKSIEPQYGAILVFWRGSPNSWQGHVGFYVGEDNTHFHVLGGNQSNSVSITRVGKNRLRSNGVRWPITALDRSTGAIVSSGKGLKTTTNEA